MTRKRSQNEGNKCPYIKRIPKTEDCIHCNRSICFYDEKRYDTTRKKEW